MILTIHQPNFFPWYPFFQKMQQADVFVLLTECQYEKNGFQNRFFYKGKWHTMSVCKGKLKDAIKDKMYCNAQKDWQRIKKELKQFDILDFFDTCISESLLKTNRDIIMALKKMLNIKTRIEMDIPTDKYSTERLIELCKYYECDTYLSGVSGASYMDLNMFKKEKIDIIYQDVRTMVKKTSFEVIEHGI